jgi:hypothetical protein
VEHGPTSFAGMSHVGCLDEAHYCISDRSRMESPCLVSLSLTVFAASANFVSPREIALLTEPTNLTCSGEISFPFALDGCADNRLPQSPFPTLCFQ